MVKKPKWHKLQELREDPRFRASLLPIFIAIGGFVVVITVLSIMMLPKFSPGTQRGYGADGFHAYVEDGGSLGASGITSNNQVVTVLGKKAKSVGNPETSKVLNLNGDRAQTLSFPFVRADGAKADLYIDKKVYKSAQSLENDHIYVATATAGKINNFPAYYKLAQTVDGDREYHLLVVNGLTAYRFVIAQPDENITISEIDAAAILKKLAQKSQL